MTTAALAMVVAYSTEAMARDNDKAAQQIRKEFLEKELKNFVNSVFGHSPTAHNWNSYNSGHRS
jgi:hypothetical protein